VSFRESIKKEFIINDYISLKLIKGKTYIFINNELFRQCKYLLIDIPQSNLENFKNVESIDEASLILDHSLEKHPNEVQISSETEFWGHSSNLQVWAENNYDTRLLHSNIAFPLLKKLTDAGDPVAKRVFKEEIALRISSGHETVIKYLINQNYLDYLNQDETNAIKPDLEQFIIHKYQSNLGELLNDEELNTLLKIILNNPKNLNFFAIHSFSVVRNLDKKVRLGLTIKNKRIEGLALRYCKLKNVHASINKLGTLKSLYLSNNLLEVIPSSVFKLSQIEEIFLNGNQISFIPREINQLYHLKRINLDHNFLQFLPKSLTELSSLEYLSLWNNLLQELPDNLGNLENLKILGLSNNHLNSLPGSIAELKQLKTLDLSNNLFSTFPEELTELDSLEVLWMNNNHITALPDSIAKMKSLKELYLINNPIKVYTDLDLQDIITQLDVNGIIVRL